MGVMHFMKRIDLTDKDKTFLLNLARQSIEYFSKNHEVMIFDPKKLPSKRLERKHATFVTLTENGTLRGCIGNIVASRPIYIDIIKNAVAAAFYDPRFPKLSKEEISKIKIEISVLTKPLKIKYSSIEDLMKKINIDEDGLILKYRNHQATFLPQVWKQIKDKDMFLSQLCIKALLPYDFWQKTKLDFYKYNVISFEEQ